MAVLHMRSTTSDEDDQKLLVSFWLEWNKTHEGMLGILLLSLGFPTPDNINIGSYCTFVGLVSTGCLYSNFFLEKWSVY